MRAKKGTRWEDGVRIPFIAAWAKPDPNNKWQKKLPIVAGGISREFGTCFDLFPTIMDFLDAPVPADHPVDGQNLTKLLIGAPDPGRRNEFLSHYPHLRNRGRGNDYFTLYVRDDWKVVYRYLAKNGQYELYDLKNDPAESRNLARSNPEKLKTMFDAMVKKLESKGAQYPERQGQALKPVIPQKVVGIRETGPALRGD